MIDTVSQTNILDRIDITKRKTYTDPELGICLYLDDSSSSVEEEGEEDSHDGKLQQKLLETDYDEMEEKSNEPKNAKKLKELCTGKVVTRKPRSITTTYLPRRVKDRIDGHIYRFKGLFVVAQGKNIRCLDHRLVLRQCALCSVKRK